ncbi:hypothetical protein [Chitinilyticum litopenaei]|uniref:hypothetical protein n=1 Tax=Chitinilyticum litopenaei TaxID=1121276 RepID=UPI0003F92749|nr:hypothetical protein [Chitinilyticum litopenaei]
MNRTRARQHGAALLLLLFIVVLGTLSLLLGATGRQDADVRRRQQSMAALQQARQALIDWSVAQAGNAGVGNCAGGGTGQACNPFELPCPDRNAPNLLAAGSSSLPCNGGAATRSGRLPWRTLDLPPLVDGYGESLWLVVDAAYAKRNGANEARKVNHDALATLEVFDASGQCLTPPGQRAVAVVFAPGPPLAGQSRPANSAADYLDAAGGRDNAVATGPFHVPPAGSGQANDQLLIITAADLERAVQQRLGREVAGILAAHWQRHGRYPAPADWTQPVCRDANPVSFCDPGPVTRCRGILPRRYPGDTPEYPGAGWFVQNVWHRTVYLAVGAGNDAACSDPQVAGVSGAFDALFLLPGPPQGSQTRLAGTALRSDLTLAELFEDPENQDGWDAASPGRDQYVLPAAGSNDRLYLCRLGECREARHWP